MIFDFLDLALQFFELGIVFFGHGKVAVFGNATECLVLLDVGDNNVDFRKPRFGFFHLLHQRFAVGGLLVHRHRT